MITPEKQLPNGWQWTKLSGLISNVQSGFACGLRDPEGVIQLRMNNVDTRGNFIWDDYIRVPAEKETIEQYKLDVDDVLFNNTNSVELVGKSAMFTGFNEPVVYSNHFTRLRTNQDLLLPDFLSAWLNLQWQKGVFANICNRWIGQSAVKPTKLLSLDFPLPPLSEQKRIVKVLNEQMAAVEKARKEAEEQLEMTKKVPSAYLREVFESEEAKKWRLVKLGEICIKISNGTTAEQNSERRGLPVTRIETISSGVIDMTRVGWIDIEQDALNGMRLMDVDILFSHINSVERLGNCAIYSGNPPVLIHGMNLLRFQVNNTVANSQYVLYYFRSNEAKKFYENKAQRAIGQASLNVRVLSTLEIPLPSIPEQKMIVERLTKQISAIGKTVNECEEQLEIVNSLPSALLRKAFRGEI
jgi:type I restriction enzyme S subunit